MTDFESYHHFQRLQRLEKDVESLLQHRQLKEMRDHVRKVTIVCVVILFVFFVGRPVFWSINTLYGTQKFQGLTEEIEMALENATRFEELEVPSFDGSASSEADKPYEGEPAPVMETVVDENPTELDEIDDKADDPSPMMTISKNSRSEKLVVEVGKGASEIISVSDETTPGTDETTPDTETSVEESSTGLNTEEPAVEGVNEETEGVATPDVAASESENAEE